MGSEKDPSELIEDKAGILLGKLALERKLISAAHLREALVVQSREAAAGRTPPRMLGEILVSLGYLAPGQLERLLAEQRSDETVRIPPASVPAKPAPPAHPTLGKYVLLRELGRGGAGVVYEAVDSELDRKVALKMLLTSFNADEKELAQDEERFLREARLSATLDKHPHIVGVYEAGSIDGKRYIAMELIPGRQMSEWRKSGSVTIRQQAILLRDVALAVDHAHKKGIIHRDLKPANVLVDAKNQPHVTDFGLAKTNREKAAVSLTVAGMIVGTPAYMSPEQARGLKTIDRRTDIYALGVMLYEILTGRTPFRGNTPIEILMKSLNDPVPPPSTVIHAAGHPALDRTVEGICMKALAKDPAQRYGSAKAFADDLTRWLKGEEVKVAPARRKRGPGILWATAAGGLIALAVLLVAAGLFDGAPHEGLVRGRALLRQERFEEAIAAFGLVPERDPGAAEAREGRAEAERRLLADLETEADQAFRARQYPKALVACEKILERQTGHRKAIQIRESALKELGPKPAPAAAPPPALPAGFLRASAPAPSGLKPGWIGEYFRGVDLRQAVCRRIDPSVEFDGSPKHPWPGSLSTGFSARWTGYVCAPKTSRYRFHIESDDGVRLFVGGETRIENWKAHPAETNEAVLGLEEGFHPVTLEYFQGEGESLLRFSMAEESSGLVLGAGHRFHDPNRFSPLEPPAQAPPPPPAVPAAPLPLRATLTGSKGGVRCAVYAPDGKLLASAGEDKLIRLWDLGRGIEIRSLQGHTDFVTSVAFSADGALLASASTDMTVRLWDVASGRELAALQGHGQQATGVVFASGGRILASSSTDNTVRLWDVAARKENFVLPGHTSGCMALAVAPDGRTLAAGCVDGRILLWDAEKGEARGTLTGHAAGVVGVSFAGDGSLLASASDDQTVRVWEIPSGRVRHILRHGQKLRHVAFAPNGRTLAAAEFSKGVRVWDALEGRELAAMLDFNYWFWKVEYSPDGRTLAAAAADWSVKLWGLPFPPAAVRTQPRQVIKGATEEVHCVAYSPVGDLLAAGSKDTAVRLWETGTGRERAVLRGHTDRVFAVAFSPDGKTLASGSQDGTVRLWDPQTGRLRLALPKQPKGIRDIQISPDGTLLATCTEDNGKARFWELPTGREQSLLEDHGGVAKVAFSPDGKFLATAGWPSHLTSWNRSGGRKLRSLMGHAQPVTAVAYFPSGDRLVSGGWDQTIRVWDLSTGLESLAPRDVAGKVVSVAVSPNGRWIGAGDNAGNAHLFAVDRPRPPQLLQPGGGGIWGVAFSPDGKSFACAHWDRTVKIWDVPE